MARCASFRVAAIAALAGPCWPAGAQGPQAEGQPQAPVFRRAVNLVMVDAYPTAGGVPIAELAQDEFEVFEDGVPQRVALFERKTFREPVPEPLRAEPRDLRESNRIAADPRSRVFVLYLGFQGSFSPAQGGGPVVRAGQVSFDGRDLERVRQGMEQRYREALGEQFDPEAARAFLVENAGSLLLRSALLACF